MPSSPHYDVIILGSGPCGCTAALYAARAGLSCLLFMGREPGGQLMTTTAVRNWPAAPRDLTGPKLMQQMHAQLELYPIQLQQEAVDNIFPCPSGFEVISAQKKFWGKTVIIAVGSKARYLQVEGEEFYKNKGVSACATCDGFFYKGKQIAVVGGGSSAALEALFLTKMTSCVHLIHRREELRAEAILKQRVFEAVEKGTIHLHLGYVIERMQGDQEKLTTIHLAPWIASPFVQTKQRFSLDIDALFVAIGRLPDTQWLEGIVKLDSAGYICTAGETGELCTQTSVPGIFAAGDAVKNPYNQAITASAGGCMAALDVQKFLQQKSAS